MKDFEAKVMAGIIVLCFVLLGLIEQVPQ